MTLILSCTMCDHVVELDEKEDIEKAVEVYPELEYVLAFLEFDNFATIAAAPCPCCLPHAIEIANAPFN